MIILKTKKAVCLMLILISSSFGFLSMVGIDTGRREKKVEFPSSSNLIGMNEIDLDLDLDKIDYVNQLTESGQYYDIDILNDILYVAAGSAGILVYDIADFYNIYKIGQYYTDGIISNVEIIDDQYIYALIFDLGIEILDISDETNIECVANYYFSENSEEYLSMCVVGDLCTVESMNGVREILYIEDILEPTQVFIEDLEFYSWNYLESPKTLLNDHFIFSYDGRENISVYDISNLIHPIKILTLNHENLTDFWIEDDLIFTAQSNKIDIYNFSPETNFTLVYSLEQNYSIQQFIVFNSTNIAIYSNSTLIYYSIDFSGEHMIGIGNVTIEFPMGDYRVSMMEYKDHVLLADYISQLHLINNTAVITGGSSDKITVTISDTTKCGKILHMLKEDILITAGYGIQITNISNPYSIESLSKYDDYREISQMRVYNNTIYAIMDEQVHILNIADDYTITHQDTSDLPKVYGMTLKYPFLYLATNDSLKVFNMSDPTNPIYANQSEFWELTFYNYIQLELFSDILVLSHLSDFWFLNISNPLNIQMIANGTISSPDFSSKISQIRMHGNETFFSGRYAIFRCSLLGLNLTATNYIHLNNISIYVYESMFTILNDTLVRESRYGVSLFDISNSSSSLIKSRNLPNYEGLTTIWDDNNLLFSKERLIITNNIHEIVIYDLNFDSDGDLLSNFKEIYKYFTDPNLIDTDLDGMIDSWEIQFELNPLVDDADEDLDGDGKTNYEEFLEGTDPLVSNLDTSQTEQTEPTVDDNKISGYSLGILFLSLGVLSVASICHIKKKHVKR